MTGQTAGHIAWGTDNIVGGEMSSSGDRKDEALACLPQGEL